MKPGTCTVCGWWHLPPACQSIEDFRRRFPGCKIVGDWLPERQRLRLRRPGSAVLTYEQACIVAFYRAHLLERRCVPNWGACGQCRMAERFRSADCPPAALAARAYETD